MTLPQTLQTRTARNGIPAVLVFTLWSAHAAFGAPPVLVDPGLPAYRPAPARPPAGVGYVKPDGSVRMVVGNHGMKTILDGFNTLFEKTHPGSKFALEFNRLGNTINLPALTYGTTMLGPMGREAMPAELLSYRETHGVDPLVIRIAHGTIVSQNKAAPLAIYVNKANPIEKLTIEQVERIFTTGGPGGDITHWGQLGLGKEWQTSAIHPYGTPEVSGFGSFMLQVKMHNRTFQPSYESFPLAAQIVKRIGEDVGGIGFLALGFLTPEVKLVAIAEQQNGNYSLGSAEDVMAGKYAYDRYVYFYVRRLAGEAIDPFVKEYIRLVLSKEGQQIIAAEPDGFLPLNASEANEELAKLR